MTRKLALLFASLFLSATLLAQTPLREQIDVDFVLVDVTVTDAEGNQILGLAESDFVVLENGVEQEIESVDYFTNRTLLTSRESEAPFDVERVRQERYFILFFHEPGDPGAIPGFSGELMRSTRAAEKLLEDLQPQDLVAIAGYDTRLKVYADFTSDRSILEKALRDVVGFSNGLREAPEYAGEVSILRNIDIKRMINKTGRVYEGLELLADAVDPIPARKVLTLLSPGIGEPSSFNRAMLANEETFFRPMIQALNASNVTVNSVAMLRDASFFPPEQTIARMANETGGEFFTNFVNFETPLEQVEKTNSGYYLITYRIRKPAGTHGYQKIDVSLRNPEFRVRAREGYSF